MKRESKPGSHSAGKADDLAKRAAELQKKLKKLLEEVSELLAQSKKVRDEMARRSRPAKPDGPSS